MEDKQIIFKRIFFCIFGAVTIAFGIFVFMSDYNDRFVCTESTEAYITDFVKSRMNRASGAERYSYTPLFEYEYLGREYKSHMDTYASYHEEWIGTKVTVMIDPKDPAHVYYDRVGIVTRIVGCIATLIGLIVLVRGVILFVRKNSTAGRLTDFVK